MIIFKKNNIKMNNMNVSGTNECGNINETIIQNLFTSNQNLITKAYISQNKRNYKETVEILESSVDNFYKIGSILDRLFIFPKILREQRDILKTSDLRYFNHPSYSSILNSIDIGSSSVKSKGPPKTKWTAEEEELFKQGIDLYGDKSKIV